MRSIMIPVIEKEINEGRQFARLRQIYDAQVLAVWFKNALGGSVLTRVYADQKKVAGLDVNPPAVNKETYQQYLEAFRTGAFNYIKEEQDPATGEFVPRKYFAGGALSVGPEHVTTTRQLGTLASGPHQRVDVDLDRAASKLPSVVHANNVRLIKKRLKWDESGKINVPVNGQTLAEFQLLITHFKWGDEVDPQTAEFFIQCLGQFNNVPTDLRRQILNIIVRAQDDLVKTFIQDMLVQHDQEEGTFISDMFKALAGASFAFSEAYRKELGVVLLAWMSDVDRIYSELYYIAIWLLNQLDIDYELTSQLKEKIGRGILQKMEGEGPMPDLGDVPSEYLGSPDPEEFLPAVIKEHRDALISQIIKDRWAGDKVLQDQTAYLSGFQLSSYCSWSMIDIYKRLVSLFPDTTGQEFFMRDIGPSLGLAYRRVGLHWFLIFRSGGQDYLIDTTLRQFFVDIKRVKHINPELARNFLMTEDPKQISFTHDLLVKGYARVDDDLIDFYVKAFRPMAALGGMVERFTLEDVKNSENNARYYSDEGFLRQMPAGLSEGRRKNLAEYELDYAAKSDVSSRSLSVKKEVGGIDLDERNLTLDVQRGSTSFTTQVQEISFALENAPGFTPVIRSVSLLNDLPAYLTHSSQ
jgi:hypothetical protein